MTDKPDGWEECMGERPDLSRATSWDLYYAGLGIHGEVRHDPSASVYVPVSRRIDGRYVRDSVETIRFWLDVEVRERQAKYHAKSIADIKKAPTRLLLRWLDLTRQFGGWYSPCEKLERDWGYDQDDIKAELAKREHVPNKSEARANRRAAATMHRKNKLRRSKT